MQRLFSFNCVTRKPVFMTEIAFTSDERNQIEIRLKAYLKQELDLDIGQFDAGFLLDFIMRDIGPAFYNRGLYDAQALLEKRLEAMREDILSLEKI